jgi:L-threonylcarbamoyladenylate synthase
VVQKLRSSGRRVAALLHMAALLPEDAVQIMLPSMPDGYAHGLYAALRAADAVGADIILVEAPPAGNEWRGINDRLRRAAHDSLGVISRLLEK